eukprot:CAMPEP_0197434062 /NCGR_PEP_ID=MMETSP1175-20131217/1839_1 /TAXON_ID=1003142 /ORGANISM="Triceratium dubium, Strain CCMP147" /LENGTH=1187 /DNA_ID=CAMNT_0042962649 /DNA_START=285 /DNA_END=3848 /DNA_ORIENTATION=-
MSDDLDADGSVSDINDVFQPSLARGPSQGRRGALQQNPVGGGLVGGGHSARRLNLGGFSRNVGKSTKRLGFSAGTTGASSRRLFHSSSSDLAGGPGKGRQMQPLDENVETKLDLRWVFLTCGSLSEIREAFHFEMLQGEGESCCSDADPNNGRLLLHCIGLNKGLIVDGGGGHGLVQEFILNELLPSYPAAIIEEDDDGVSPFMEAIIDWIGDRRAARRKRVVQEKYKGLADMVQDAAKTFFSARSFKDEPSDNGSVSTSKTEVDSREGMYDLPPLVEWSLQMLSAIVGRPPTLSPFRNIGSNDKSGPQKNDSVVQDAYDSLFVIDQEGTIEMVNEAAVKEFGWSEEEFLGANIRMVCGGGHGPRHDAYLKRYLQTGEKRVMGKKDRKLIAKRKNGSEFPISLGITETRGGEGQPRRFCGFVRHWQSEEAPEVDSLRTSLRRTSWMSRGSIISSEPTGNIKLGMASYQGDVYDELIVEKLASIPNLMEELLLIEDDAVRERVFDLSIVRKALLCSESFGDGKWLMKLLNSGVQSHSVSKRRSDLSDYEDTNHDDTMDSAECAVFYLERVSQVTQQDDVFDHVKTRTENGGDVSTFQERKHILFDNIGNLDGLVRTLCELEGDLLKRSAVTRVIQRKLDKTIFSPFALSAALFDGILHVIFICAFRLGPAEAMFHLSPTDESFRPWQYLAATIFLVACIVHFSLKKAQLSLAKRKNTPELFWRQMTDPVNSLDDFTILMVAYCVFSVDSILRDRALGVDEESFIPFRLRVAVALTTPLLWLRILGHIKMFNKQLATFILCSVEILSDIKWFLLVLLIAISAFAQMIVSLTYEPLNQQESDLEYQYFSMEGYLKAYTIMLGDIDAASLQQHSSIVVLFVIYTFAVTIVLLNILIAIVSESYGNAMYASSVMLGKARVIFVADIMSMKKSHAMWKEGEFGNLWKKVDLVCFAFSAATIKMAVSTVNAKLTRQGSTVELFLGFPTLGVESFILFVVLTAIYAARRSVAVYLLGSLGKGRSFAKEMKKTTTINFIGHLTDSLSTQLGRSIDVLTENDNEEHQEGSTKVESLAASGAGSDDKLRHALSASKKELKSEIKQASDQIRHLLEEAEGKSQSDIHACEDHLTTALLETKEWVASTMAASEERIISTIAQQLEERLGKLVVGHREDAGHVGSGSNEREEPNVAQNAST